MILGGNNKEEFVFIKPKIGSNCGIPPVCSKTDAFAFVLFLKGRL